MAILSKKVAIKKIFPQLCNTFWIFILNMHFLFCCKNQKNVLQIKIKDFEVCFLTQEPNSWFPLIESWKMTCARSYVWFLNFLSNGVGLDCFLQPNVLPKLGKITVTYPPVQSAEKKINRINFDMSKVSQMNINFELIKGSKMTSLKICISSVT